MERISLEEALERLLAHTRIIEETRAVALGRALGSVNGEAVYAPFDNPPFDRSPLDGFAVRSEDSRAATPEKPVTLRIVGEASAGNPFAGAVTQGEAARVMTGAMMPVGSDCVVAKEHVQERAERVELVTPLGHHENYVFKGEDIRSGQLLIPKGERLGFAHLGVLAGMGMERVSVLRQPDIGVLSTGDELVSAGTPLSPGKIYSSNDAMLSARLEELGFSPRVFPSINDDAAAAAEIIAAYMEKVDVLITTGAVSVGERDIFHEVFTRMGVERLLWRINGKPGTLLCGAYRGKLLLSLSGNPFACLSMFELLVKPTLGKLASRPDLATRRCQASLTSAFSINPGMRRFVRARLENGTVSIRDGHSSGQLFSFVGCNCFVDIPAGNGVFPAGSRVEAILI